MEKKDNKKILIGIIVFVLIALAIFLLLFNRNEGQMSLPNEIHAEIEYAFNDNSSLSTISMDMNQKFNSSQFITSFGLYTYVGDFQNPVFYYNPDDAIWYSFKSVDGVDFSYNITDLYKLFLDKFNNVRHKKNVFKVSISMNTEEIELLKKYVKLMAFDTTDYNQNDGYICELYFNNEYIYQATCSQNGNKRISIAFSRYNDIDKTNLFRSNEAKYLE